MLTFNEQDDMKFEYSEAKTEEEILKVNSKWFWKITKWEVRDTLLKYIGSDILLEELIKSSPPVEVEYRERLVKMLEHSRKNG